MKITRSVICFLLAAITMIVTVCPVGAFAEPEIDDSHMLTDEKTVVCENEDEALTVTCAKLNVRCGPGTGYSIIGSLERGDTVRRTCVMDNGWSRILYNGKPAYCSSSYLTPVRFGNVDEAQEVTSNTLNVRSGPGTMWSVVGKYELGDAVRRIGVGTNGWSKIVYNGTTAYCHSSYLDDVTFKTVNQTVYVKGTSVNVRNGACKEFSKIGTLKYAQAVKRIGIGSNGWSKIIYNGQTAYCSSKYLSTSKPIDGSYFNIVVGEPGADPDVVNYANQYWNDTVPAWLKQRFVNEGWHMIVSAIPLKIRYNCNVSVAGIADPRLETIFLDNRKSAVRRSMIHELGHFVDCINDYPSTSVEFQLIFESEKNDFIDCTSIGDGHEISSSTEYFASVMCNIILNNQNCQWQIPRTYAFVVGYMH